MAIGVLQKLLTGALLLNSSFAFAGSTPFSVGDFKKIYDPSIGEAETWYINDHTFIQDANRTWHMFGISHAEPADPLNETQLAHATAKYLTQSQWQKESTALIASKADGESVLWAPYIVKENNLYYMFYCAGNADQDHKRFRIHLATSTDLYTWTRSSANPLIEDGYDARDPFVMKVKDHWVLYYTATSRPR